MDEQDKQDGTVGREYFVYVPDKGDLKYFEQVVATNARQALRLALSKLPQAETPSAVYAVLPGSAIQTLTVTVKKETRLVLDEVA